MSPSAKPRVFVGSSVEGLPLAQAIQANLSYVAQVTLWSQGVFALNQTALASLLEHLESTDFAVFVFSPDDQVRLRGEEWTTARDNVLFELGLSMGKLGPNRAFFVKPRGMTMFRIPTDLFGIQAGDYEADRDDGNLSAALGVFTGELARIIKKWGRRQEIRDIIERKERLEAQLHFLYSLIKYSKHTVETRNHVNRILDKMLGSCHIPETFSPSAATLFSLVDRELVQIGHARDVDEDHRFRLDHNELFPQNQNWMVAAFLSNESVMGCKGQFGLLGEYEYIISIPIAKTYVITFHLVTHTQIAESEYDHFLEQFTTVNKPLLDTFNVFLERGVELYASQQPSTQKR
ncbi:MULTISPECIES: TIR domain-containing protein [Brevibacillus]|jgi:hypothetical protein|uniref:CD-NTase-associated protein 12/Pycsar effector protein TIR domain-containing protein n=1 Tax=Brevibacillus borstelensis AK1 TaxID=1300222 RepID=M8DUI4_9BACL|nr:nucleotide-binding protein [Brevibacillus borstelensis]EMT50621.1 hypothetical protein I532_21175 [Brevibacillus borstelensis AK1]MCC0564602.1 nucleotide-binding protein [Brevibacillus borstelensis]MCM3470515.1 nucleotide-binding protein [Brevibacillus borstelensis]MCM3558069.1 nucleotide-binding protein [Brevibacillus borstelensis]MCM3592916.1 nucleotide-binding protein [Brevibacillus borstelensis]